MIIILVMIIIMKVMICLGDAANGAYMMGHPKFRTLYDIIIIIISCSSSSSRRRRSSSSSIVVIRTVFMICMITDDKYCIVIIISITCIFTQRAL